MTDKAKTPSKDAEAAKRKADEKLDEALEESFPASDPMPMTRTSAGAPEERESDETAPARKGAKD